MIGAALAAMAAIAAAGRALYPGLVERRAERRRRLGPDGIIEGAAPIALDRESAPAVLLLHGGGDTPQVMAALARHLYEHGYAVRAPLLSCHGRRLSALTEASAEAWYREGHSLLQELRAAHPWVAIVGLSIGGAVAARLAADVPDLPALVLLVPYLDMPVPVQRLAVTSPYWGWLLPYFPSGGKRSILDSEAAAKTLGHGILTPAALRAFRETMLAGRAALPRVRTPTLVIHSRGDNRIAVPSAEGAFAALGSTEKLLEWVDGAGHVITVDFGHEHVFARVAEWLGAHGGISLRERARPGPPRSP